MMSRRAIRQRGRLYEHTIRLKTPPPGRRRRFLLVLAVLFAATAAWAIAGLAIGGAAISPHFGGNDRAQLSRVVVSHHGFQRVPSITVFTSTTTVRAKEVVAIRTWLAIGPDTHVLIFVDDANGTKKAIEASGLVTDGPMRRVQILDNPEPRSRSSGKVLLRGLIEIAEMRTGAAYLLLINSDILLYSSRIARVWKILRELSSSGGPSLAATSMRADCYLARAAHIMSAEQLERDVKEPCNIYSPTAVDWFLFPRGFWSDRLAARGLTSRALEMFMGVPRWDILFMGLASESLIDITPVMVALHLQVNERKTPTGLVRGADWRDSFPNNQRIVGEHQAWREGRGELSDEVFNAVQFCHAAGNAVGRTCPGIKGGLRYARYQLCPDGSVQLNNLTRSQSSYHRSVWLYRQTLKSANASVRPLDGYVRSSALASVLGCPVSSASWTFE